MSADSSIVSLRRAFQRRELLAGFIRRELKSRFRGSALGFLWSFANPLLLLAVYGTVFGIVMHVRDSGGRAPYALFLLAGLLPWTFVASSLSAAVASVVVNAALVKKIAFPVEMLPLSHVGAGFINLLLGMGVLAVITLLTVGASLTWALVPFLLLLLLPLVTGLALLAAVLDVYFRDIEHIIGVGLTAWFFLTPIVYPERLYASLPAAWHWLPYANPLTGWVIAYRDALLEGRLPTDPAVLDSLVYLVALGIVLLVGGYAVFVRLGAGFEEEL